MRLPPNTALQRAGHSAFQSIHGTIRHSIQVLRANRPAGRQLSAHTLGDMLGFLGVVLTIGIIAVYVEFWWVHRSFWRLLRSERPDLSEELRGYNGRQLRWIGFALRGDYRGVGSDRLERAGERLVASHKLIVRASVVFVILMLALDWMVSIKSA